MAGVLGSMRGVDSTRLIVISLVGVVFLVMFGFLSMRLTEPVYSPLYSNLESEDASSIVAELGAMGVKFSVGKGGSEILAPSEDVLGVRMALAQKGLPARGSIVGYEIFDKSEALGTSSFVHNVNYIRALEGELGRTIGSFKSIQSARVHLVIPKRRLFKSTNIEASASVALTLKGHQAPTKEQIMSISNLIATAVPGLKPSHVTIVDGSGVLLARGAGDEDGNGEFGVTASTADEYRQNFEMQMKNAIENLLERSIGIESVKAEVSAEIAFDKVVTNSEVYDPEGQVVRSVQSSSSTEASSDRKEQQVSVINNLPNAGVAGGDGAGSSNNAEKADEVTNFEISKTITNRISDVGVVKKLSIAVLVDGGYSVDLETDERVYKARSEEELEQIKTLVQAAVGFDETRGDKLEVINMQFSRTIDNLMPEEGAFDWLKKDFDSIIKTLVMGVVAILAILLVVRPLVNRAFEIMPGLPEGGAGVEAIAGGAIDFAQLSEGAEAAMLESDGDNINIDEIQTKVNSSASQKVNDLVANNPEETLALVRTWLAEKD